MNNLFNIRPLMNMIIPESVKDLCGLSDKEEKIHQVDVLWGYLKVVKEVGTNDLMSDSLFRVAEVVLTIPHSNTGEEIFSYINKNKTLSRSSLSLTGTLSSIITVKKKTY